MGKSKDMAIGWDAADEMVGAGDLVVLNEDADSIDVAVVGPPTAVKTKAFGSEGHRVVFPVVSIDGLAAMPVGARVYRKIHKLRELLDTRALSITRHGAGGDTNTHYSVTLIDMPDHLAKAKEGVTAKDIAAVMQAGIEIVTEAR